VRAPQRCYTLESQDVSQTHHLIRRNGVWYYRRRVPQAFQSVLGKKEIHVSLGTNNLPEAKKLRAVEDLKWSAQFENAANCTAQPHTPVPDPTAPGQMLSESEVLQRVREYVAAEGARSCCRLAHETFTQEERTDAVIDIEYATSILRDNEDPRLHELIEDGCKAIAPVQLAPGGATNAFLAEVVRRGLVELQQRKLSVLSDDHSRSFFDQLFDPKREPDVTFRQLADQMLANVREEAAVNDTSLKWVDKQRGFLDLLAEIVGAQTSVQSIDYDACLKVRGTLARLPAGRTKAYGGLSLEQAICSG
jgi:uncharacterized protein DUF6538